MSITYTPLTNFSAKDDMSSSNPDKIVSGVPFDAEFTAISQSFALAAPSLNASFTGTTTVETANVTSLVAGSEVMVEADYTGFKAASVAVAAKEAGWDATKATVDADSAGWDATKATVDAGNANWDTAYGWGDHASEGYITSFTNTEYTAGDGVDLVGTVFSHSNTSDTPRLDANRDYVMTGIDFDAYGHVVGRSYASIKGGTNVTVDGDLSSDTQLTINGSPDPEVDSVVLSNGFVIDQTASTVIIRNGATKLFKLDASGNLTVIGDIIAYGTIS